MRISIFIATPVCLLTIFVIWWAGTHDMDFLTPPSEARLQEIRLEALAALPVSTMQDDAISIRMPLPSPDPTLPEPPKEIIPVDLGDLTTPPVLDTYSNRAPEGSAKLLALASALENQGAFQRALLAYERVLDLSRANPEQIQTATSSIQKLKPTLTLWNTDPDTAQPITIHIGTGEKFSKILPEILENISTDLGNTSSGLLTFSHKLNIGRSIQTNDAPTPVALWITGGGKESPSTDVLSFTTDNPEDLRNDLLKTIFNLIRSHLSKSTAYSPAPEVIAEPLPAFETNITRLLWQEFGTLLNPPVEE
ncbi:MAG: hypothetical protein IZT59_08035 [Verrucomicrobia bacterium]|jgi:hypothetical protein|nr:hypothetical protein [Verrucomicrobiota bacterium]|tara:strand:+ start:18018 stop:18941 length:924 start_codon:yes stop_codon:yes gene_type:complete